MHAADRARLDGRLVEHVLEDRDHAPPREPDPEVEVLGEAELFAIAAGGDVVDAPEHGRGVMGNAADLRAPVMEEAVPHGLAPRVRDVEIFALRSDEAHRAGDE